MKFDFVVIAVIASIANGKPYCEDSNLKFNINGSKGKCKRDDLVCSGDFNSDVFSSHCKTTCGVTNCCIDAVGKFWTGPGSGYKDCNWVGKEQERCDDEDVANTCPVSCKLCAPTSIDDLMLKIDMLEESQARICDHLDDFQYFEDAGCLPLVLRDNEEKVYVKNSLSTTWEAHKEIAIACGGNLADILDERENEQAASLISLRAFIGGRWKDFGPIEPLEGFWFWPDGNQIEYTNWKSDPPKPSGLCAPECMEMLPEWDFTWDGQECDRTEQEAIYVLPTNFTSNNCLLVL